MKKWIIGVSSVIREEEISKIEITFDGGFYQATAYAQNDIYLALLVIDSDKDLFLERLNKTLN